MPPKPSDAQPVHLRETGRSDFALCGARVLRPIGTTFKIAPSTSEPASATCPRCIAYSGRAALAAAERGGR